MKPGWAAAWLIGFSIIVTLLAAGVILLVSSRPRGEPIRIIPAPTQPPLVVQVGGAVVNPGVYRLPPGSRVLDAIRAAGGFTPNADAALINQAALVQDGQVIWAPLQSSQAQNPSGTPLPQSDIPSNTPPAIQADYPLNLNTATAEELETLPGIGAELARRIVAYRNTFGPFARVEDILAVDGIGPKILEKIKDLITVTAPGDNQLP